MASTSARAKANENATPTASTIELDESFEGGPQLLSKLEVSHCTNICSTQVSTCLNFRNITGERNNCWRYKEIIGVWVPYCPIDSLYSEKTIGCNKRHFGS